MESKRNLAAMISVCMILLVPMTAVASFPDQWTRDPGNPLLIDLFPTTIIHHDGHYEMWGEVGDGFGQATSPDGRSWTVSESNPVLVRGPGWYDELEIANASVVIVDGTYHMWYSCIAADDDNRIAHATSPDGLVWEKDSANPVMDLGPPGSLDSSELIHPFVMIEGETFHMWYNGHDEDRQRILHATSLDGTSWNRDSVAALEPGSPGEWDDDLLAMMCVVPFRGYYHMFYTGLGTGFEAGIGYASSVNGQDWIKWRTSEPILEPGEPGAWDDLAVLQPVVLATDTEFMMWYGGTRDFETFSAGIASAAFMPTRVPESTALMLGRNYPNPFNPRTTIQYTLEKTATVSLVIHDAAGHLVRQLIDQCSMEEGRHEVSWDGRDGGGRTVSAGVYFYQLEADGARQTRRMVLVK